MAEGRQRSVIELAGRRTDADLGSDSVGEHLYGTLRCYDVRGDSGE
jgi:hypothetical protein